VKGFRPLGLTGLVVLCLATLSIRDGASGTQCNPTTSGLDLSFANSARGPFLGRALGQSFLATDSVITKITVWRPAGNLSMIGAKLYIVEVDTTWSPPRPRSQQLLLDGPTILVFDSSPPGQDIEIPFVIDPPLHLPRLGLYAFFVQVENCFGSEAWRLLVDEQNHYPYGIAWITGRVTQPPCHLRFVDGGEDSTDHVFQVEYCSDTPTPTLRRSWGELKIRYR
jgi:hypothetical protein